MYHVLEQVKEGDEVAAGDVLCEVETDKATMAWENQDEGFVARILLEAGAQNIPVGTAAVVRPRAHPQHPTAGHTTVFMYQMNGDHNNQRLLCARCMGGFAGSLC